MSLTKPDVSHWPQEVQRNLETRPGWMLAMLSHYGTTAACIADIDRRLEEIKGHEDEIASVEPRHIRTKGSVAVELQDFRAGEAALYRQHIGVSVEDGERLREDAKAMAAYSRATNPPLEYSEDFLD